MLAEKKAKVKRQEAELRRMELVMTALGWLIMVCLILMAALRWFK